MSPAAGPDLRPGEHRFVTRRDGVESRHSFSFGSHYDPGNTSFGLLLASNDEVLGPGAVFAPHPHRHVEIVTWVVSGELTHQTGSGDRHAVPPGGAQLSGAGAGLEHAESNVSESVPVHLVQMWVAPDQRYDESTDRCADFSAELGAGRLVPVASGRGHDGALRLRQRAAVLYAARLTPAATVQLPAAPWVHLYVAQGGAVMEDAGRLGAGDAVRLTDSPALQLEAGDRGAEVLVWEMHAAPDRSGQPAFAPPASVSS
ncbi:MAG: pirin family protein [Actinomycetota bacterium]|nr:pirin family protein [Actinomycetota bacterium]